MCWANRSNFQAYQEQERPNEMSSRGLPGSASPKNRFCAKIDFFIKIDFDDDVNLFQYICYHDDHQGAAVPRSRNYTLGRMDLGRRHTLSWTVGRENAHRAGGENFFIGTF
jgi:hypothetical protein